MRDYILTPPDGYIEMVEIEDGLTVPKVSSAGHQNIGKLSLIKEYAEPLRKQLISEGIPEPSLIYTKTWRSEDDNPSLRIFIHSGKRCSLPDSVGFAIGSKGLDRVSLKFFNVKDDYIVLKNYHHTVKALAQVELSDGSVWKLSDKCVLDVDYSWNGHVNREISLKTPSVAEIARFYQAICCSKAYPAGPQWDEEAYLSYSPSEDAFTDWWAKAKFNPKAAYQFLTGLSKLGKKETIELPVAENKGDATLENIRARYKELYSTCEQADEAKDNVGESYRELLFGAMLDKGVVSRDNKDIVMDIVSALFPDNKFIEETRGEGEAFLSTLLDTKMYGSCAVLTLEPVPGSKNGNRTYDSPYMINERAYYVSSQWGWNKQALRAQKVIEALCQHAYVTEEVQQRLRELSLAWELYSTMKESQKQQKSKPEAEKGAEAGEDLAQNGEDEGSETNIPHPRNRILFGAPGTGKSYVLKQQAEEYFYPENVERVTFHPEYSYFDFVGSYKPKMEGKGEEERIKYRFVPGPFIRILKAAMAHPEQKYLLVIEEINRARVAAVFGDIFQLLDRDEDGVSEYGISPSEELKAHLEMEDTDKLQIPANLYIWATMNSADQGVYPMDTAFKRRWNFEYRGIDADREKVEGTHTKAWHDLRESINKLLQEAGVNEDKQMGPFFMSPNELKGSAADFLAAFKNKVIMYLFEDAAKHKREQLFRAKAYGKRYSEVCVLCGENTLDAAAILRDVFGVEPANPTP